MFRTALLVLFALAVTAAQAQTAFPDGTDGHAKFAWIQANTPRWCKEPKKRYARFEDLPFVKRSGLNSDISTEELVIAGIKSECRVPADETTAQAQ
ncbi:MAG TPA: hypothetical protein VGP13_00780 [Candidatus Paceibacterota bacterium]|jgi:hypothetical protein|nr:hypothetical protein [Candidatus Paceibacterota bacterium]